MKKLLIVAFLFGSAFSVCAQLVMSTGSQIVVASGSQLVVNDITNSSGTIDNDGTVTINGDVTNNGGGLFANTSDGTVTFAGSSAQEITGTAPIHYYGTLNINNSTGVSITNTSTGAAQEIHDALTFTSGKLTLNNFNLTIGSTDPTGVGASAYIVTNGTGQLKRIVASSDVIFPVGNSAYNPLTLNNTGTSDTYGVKVVDSKPASFSGTTHIVDRSWDVTEAVPDNSNLTVTTQWNAGEEATGYDRSTSAMGITTNGGSDVTWSASSTSTGSNPYVHSQSGYTGVGTFMLGDYTYGGIVIDLQAFLAGAYNSTNHNMDKDLNTGSPNLIPTTDPYLLGTTVSSVPADAVDWVKIEIRDASNNTSVLYSVARFIDQSGQIIEEDGSNCMLTGIPSGTYYIAIRHRNHFGVMSASTVNLASSPTLSFKTDQTTAYQSGTSNAAMKVVEGSVFGLWEGDANGDGIIRYDGADNDRLVILNALTNAGATANGYAETDVNLDGITRYDGASNDRLIILNNLSNAGSTITENIPN